jgi:hypothetical protein
MISNGVLGFPVTLCQYFCLEISHLNGEVGQLCFNVTGADSCYVISCLGIRHTLAYKSGIHRYKPVICVRDFRLFLSLVDVGLSLKLFM